MLTTLQTCKWEPLAAIYCHLVILNVHISVHNYEIWTKFVVFLPPNRQISFELIQNQLLSYSPSRRYFETMVMTGPSKLQVFRSERKPVDIAVT